jgi:hypothetical protein
LKSEHNAFQSGINESLTQLRNLPFSSLMSVVTKDDLATQKTDLESKTQALVTLSDDLSDQIDDLRIDITQRRIRPHPRQITHAHKQEASVQKSLDSVESLLRQLKPLWKRKWEEELQQVIDGQEFLRHQETLINDLRKDLTDTSMVIEQIVQATELFENAAPVKREWMSGALGSGGRDAMLTEVKTLQPNSAERLEAIKRAEKARLRELEMRRETEFQAELGEVVTEGKLKVLEEGALRIEREREEKERKLRRELWEEQNKSGMDKANGNGVGHGVDKGNDREPSKVLENGAKRVVSEGSSAFADKVVSDDGVVRSQSHSSGLLSRIKAVAGSSKRLSSDLGWGASIVEIEGNEDSPGFD